MLNGLLHQARRDLLWLAHLSLFAFNINYMDPVPVSDPQATPFSQAAAKGLQRRGSKGHHVVWGEVPATCRTVFVITVQARTVSIQHWVLRLVFEKENYGMYLPPLWVKNASVPSARPAMTWLEEYLKEGKHLINKNRRTWIFTLIDTLSPGELIRIRECPHGQWGHSAVS